MQRLNGIALAVEALISPDPLRKEYLGYERLVQTLYDAVKPDPAVVEFAAVTSCLSIIAAAIRERTGGTYGDITGVMGEINRLLDASIAADGFVIRKGAGDHSRILDLSKIDFEALAKRFTKSKTRNIELEQLKAAIRIQLEAMVRANRTRVDFLARFGELIATYNAGSRNIEELFNELPDLSRTMTDEQQRHVREHLTEEELTVFDILTRPGPELTPEDALDEGLPRAYSPELYKTKCCFVFQHVYESYGDQGISYQPSSGG